MRPVGQALLDVPTNDFRPLGVLLAEPLRRLRLPWFQRLTLRHTHDFVRLARLIEPRREVFDCGCGARRVVNTETGEQTPIGLRPVGQRALIDASQIQIPENLR